MKILKHIYYLKTKTKQQQPMRNFTTVQETEQLVELLKQKPEIDGKIKYYKGVLLSIDKKIQSIDKRIKKGYKRETYKIFFIPILKNVVLDSYDIASLEYEKLNLEAELFYKQQLFESWLKRSKDYENKVAEITADCNQNYEKVYEEAVELAKKNPRLAQVMGGQDKDIKDQKLKNEFYLYIKKEVENSKQYAEKKFSVVK